MSSTARLLSLAYLYDQPLRRIPFKIIVDIVGVLNTFFNFFTFLQIDVALNDDSRVIEKSRVPWEESKRLDKSLEDDTNAVINSESDGQNDFIGDEEGEKSSRRNSGNANRRFDPECYDDRPFYSMLLKVSLNIDGPVRLSGNIMSYFKRYLCRVSNFAGRCISDHGYYFFYFPAFVFVKISLPLNLFLIYSISAPVFVFYYHISF